MSQKNSNIGPYILLTFVFFIVGFMTIINGQCQVPLKEAFLSEVGDLRNTLTTLISFFFFSGFLLNGVIGGRWINIHGYKITLLRGLGFMLIGILFYILSAIFADRYEDFTFSIGIDIISFGYIVFLLGSLFMGISAALLQTVITPYVSACDIPNTQAVQRVNITCAFNSLGTMIAPFFVTVVIFGGVAVEDINVSSMIVPFLLIGLSIFVTRMVISRFALPDMDHIKSEADEEQNKSIWSFRHLRLGVVAIFFYVGAEVAVGTNINLHALELLNDGGSLTLFGSSNLIVGGVNLSIPAFLATLYWGGMMIGRILSGFANQVTPRVQLAVASLLAIILVVIAVLSNNLWVLASVGLCHSVMWGCIFTLAVKGLKKYTSKASGVFMMRAFGGAIFPMIQGFLADYIGTWQWTWLLIVVCEVVMFYYAILGSRIQKVDINSLK